MSWLKVEQVVEVVEAVVEEDKDPGAMEVVEEELPVFLQGLLYV